MERRTLLKQTAGYAVSTLAGSQLALIPATRPARAAIVDAEATLIAGLFPGLTPENSDQVRIEAPFVTKPDLGFVAQVTAGEMRLDAVALMVSGAANPLAHAIRFHKPSSSFRATVMMERTAEIKAYVLSAGRLYRNSLYIKVTLGGYGTSSL